MPVVKKAAKAAAKPAAEKPESAPRVSTFSVEDGFLTVDLKFIANSPQNEREAAIGKLRRLVARFEADPHGVLEESS